MKYSLILILISSLVAMTQAAPVINNILKGKEHNQVMLEEKQTKHDRMVVACAESKTSVIMYAGKMCNN